MNSTITTTISASTLSLTTTTTVIPTLQSYLFNILCATAGADVGGARRQNPPGTTFSFALTATVLPNIPCQFGSRAASVTGQSIIGIQGTAMWTAGASAPSAVHYAFPAYGPTPLPGDNCLNVAGVGATPTPTANVIDTKGVSWVDIEQGQNGLMRWSGQQDTSGNAIYYYQQGPLEGPLLSNTYTCSQGVLVTASPN